MNAEIKEKLLNRFIKYVKTYSQSDSVKADEGIMPSTPQQFEMAKILCAELKSLGLQNVQTTEYCYTYGFLPANNGSEKTICLLAHIDTVDEVSGLNVNPQVSEENGDTIIRTDGSTLLGADDKAGVAEIMTVLEYFVEHPDVKHCGIEVIFSPDEETGHGMDKVPLELIKSKCAYTVDGGSMGELEVECFNAWKSEIEFTGVACHTGTARGVMVNAISMAAAFLNNLPHGERPETTDGYQGFYAPMSVEGSIEKSKVVLFLRDFDLKEMENRRNLVEVIARSTAASFGGMAKVVHTRQYLNMKSKMDEAPDVVSNLVKAYKAAGIEPKFVPIRGGTDGSRLTEMGIPTPNIFTGGHNFHSREEWASLNEMSMATSVLINLAKI
ncbi:MAG: peptidase T [Treponema sp.]|nr:peptidase T [Spirochaetia bacterium]MDD7460511.1 peptidase T [Spirochaetales bacterium]MDY5812057.1 peptidase T [Treponema sp.]